MPTELHGDTRIKLSPFKVTVVDVEKLVKALREIKERGRVIEGTNGNWHCYRDECVSFCEHRIAAEALAKWEAK